MEGARGTKPYTKRIPVEKPNTGQLHRTVRDGPLNGPVGATNHTHTVCHVWYADTQCSYMHDQRMNGDLGLVQFPKTFGKGYCSIFVFI